MQAVLARFSRGLRLWTVLAVLGVALAACGGSSDKNDGPTPTAMPMSQAVTPTPAGQTAQPTMLPVSSPVASPVASPAASPVADGWTPSITRSEFEQQLAAKYPMEAAAKSGGTLIVGSSGDISTVNPVLMNDSATISVVGAIFETLVGSSPIDGSIVPALADSWEISPDGLTYRFHINTAAKWQDGVDVTADDVKFSFDAALNPNTGNSYTTTINENVVSYRVIDADTFEVTARDRYVSFLLNGPGTVFIVPKHIWETIDPQSWSFDGGSTGTDPARVVGSGPFKFKEWVQGDHVTIERNPDYYNGVANLDSVIFRVLPDTDTAVLALENGETDVLEVIPAADTARIQGNSAFKVDVYYTPLITGYMFNLDQEKTELFQDQAVRQALMMALDRQSIKDNIYLGFGEAAIGSQPPLSPAYAPDQIEPKLDYSVQGALDLMASVGWKDNNGDGTLDRGGVKMKFKLTYVTGDSTTSQLVSYMQEAWKAIGVDVELVGLGGDAYTQAFDDRDFDMILVAFNLGTDFSETLLFGCDQYTLGFNAMKYCNPEWDQLDERQKREFDSDARTQLLIEQSQIIWADQPMGMVRFGIFRTGYDATIHNFYPNGYGFLWSLQYVWIE